MRKTGSNRLVLFAAVLAAVFSLAFFLGRNTVPYEIAVSTQRPISGEDSADELLQEDALLPTKSAEEDLTSAAQERSLPASADAIDLNRATEEDLLTLPGIGQTLAQRIVEYRNTVGAFSAPEQIMDVDGIGSGIFEKIRELITVEELQ